MTTQNASSRGPGRQSITASRVFLLMVWFWAIAMAMAMPPVLVSAATEDVMIPGEVIAESLDVFTEPDDRGFVVGRLPRGQRLMVQSGDQEDWLAILPPPEFFCWVEEGALKRGAGDRVEVAVGGAQARAGGKNARMPGPPVASLDEGETLRLLEEIQPLRLSQEGSERVLLAVRPPEGIVYHVQRLGVRTSRAVPVRGTSGRSPASSRIPAASSLVSLGGSIPKTALSDDQIQTLQRIERNHRGILLEPVTNWQLGDVRAQYERLAAEVPDSDCRREFAGRLAQVQRQERLGEAARDLETQLAVRPLPEADAPEGPPTGAASDRSPADRRPPDAQGLLQPSSRLTYGRKVYALVGEDGATSAYLVVPPGMIVDRYLSRRVAVRGSLTYDNDLRNRVIEVRDLIPLEKAP